MKETKEIRLPIDTPPEISRKILGKDEKNGWKVTISRSELVYVLIREVPDPSAVQTPSSVGHTLIEEAEESLSELPSPEEMRRDLWKNYQALAPGEEYSGQE